MAEIKFNATARGMANGAVVYDKELGLGRLVMDGESISFFDLPSKPEVVLNVGERTFRQVGLAAQTRVWWRNGDGWLVGRIDSPVSASADAYFVHFPNGRTEQVPVADLRFRWNQRLKDPLALLIAGTVETKFLYDRRNDFALRVAQQRSASLGLTGLLASGVELHEHQVGAARRVLSDPIPRYLLADEVGLGKTIEAGMVLRQLLTDLGGKALVLVPDHLVAQWSDELRAKFAVDYLRGSVEVIGHSSLAAQRPSPLTALVVDEAHRFAEGASAFAPGSPYQALRALTEHAHCLLLLSATPVRSNEDAFLGLLHLLDPALYPLDDLEAFRSRVAKRDDIATALSALGDQTPVRYLRQPLLELSSLLPADENVRRAVDRAIGALDAGDLDSSRREVSGLRLLVSETYRLHRRMVRTRRDAAINRQFPVRGRVSSSSSQLRDPDSRRWEVLASLESFRIALGDLPSSDARGAFQTVVGRCSAPVSALEDLARALRGRSDHDLSDDEQAAIACVSRHEIGLQFAKDLDVIFMNEVDHDRITAVVEWCRLRVARGKWAIACSFPATAKRIAEVLVREFGQHRVAALLESQTTEERVAGIRSCRQRSECTLLVIDRSSEEGANLQFVEEVLHANIPAVTSQLEQRLGRFDRWSEIDRPVVSHIFVDENPILDTDLRAWERVQVGVFDALKVSTSIMQYVIADAEIRFFTDAVQDSLGASAAAQEARASEYEEQRRHILAQDLLDSIEDRDQDSTLVDNLVQVDRSDRAFQLSFNRYAHEMLQFAARFEDNRVQYGVNKRQPPLVPERDIADIGMRNFNRWYTADRLEAGEGLGFLRSGDPLVDGFERLLQHDDRGRAFLIEIPLLTHEAGRAPLVAFHFDFRMSVNDENGSFNDGESRAAHTHAAQHCPELVERIWWLPGRGECPRELRIVLERNQANGVNLGSRPERFRELSAGLDWSSLCRTTRDLAFEAVLTRRRVRSHVEKALRSLDQSAERESGILLARHESDSVMDQVRRVAAHSHQLITDATPVLEACGGAFVTWDLRS